MKEIKPTMLLKDRGQEIEGNLDFSNKDVATSHPPMVAEINSGQLSALNQVEVQPDIINTTHPGGHMNISVPTCLHLSSSQLTEDEKFNTLSLSDRQGLSHVAPSQSSYFVGQLPAPMPNIGALGLHYLQRVVLIAMERAIKKRSWLM